MNNYRKLYLFFSNFILVCTIISIVPNEMKCNTTYTIASDLILTSDDKPTGQLQNLLDLLNIKHDGTLSSIVTQTQKEWLRQVGKERWEVQEIYPEFKDSILISAHKLGFIEQVWPTQKHYKYAVILGATVKRMRTRLAYLLKLWQKGITFDHVIFLVSERPLDSQIESKEMILDDQNGELTFAKDWKLTTKLPATESEVAHMIYEQTDLPVEFKKIPVTFINTLMIKNDNGATRRPTTGDTILEWLATHPIHGDCLFISNQPYVGYQDSVIRTYMPTNFGTLQTCGPKASDSLRNSEILDTLARFLYQEKIRKEKKK